MSYYKKRIKLLAKHRVNERVPNGLVDHARMLIQTMFEFGRSEILIYTGGLHREAYGHPDLVAAVEKYLTEGKRNLRILLQSKPEDFDTHPLIIKLKEMKDRNVFAGSVEIRCAAGSYAVKDSAKHFAVMDGEAFRFEIRHCEDKETASLSTCEAVANFNEPKIARHLRNVFEQAVKISTDHFEQPIFGF